MPGRGSYGPGGKWIHDRAHRIMEESDAPKNIAYAVATQQAHKTGKSPKAFRTAKGLQEARAKYDQPRREYQKTARLAFFSELGKIAEGRTPNIPEGDKSFAASLFRKSRGVGTFGTKKPPDPNIRAVATKISAARDSIPGGMADGRPPSAYPEKQMRMGQKVEMEHTDDPAKAREIASDHLEEFPDYYTALAEMERKLKAKHGDKEKTANGDEETSSGKRIPQEALLSFFRKNPKPSDEQVHELAEAYGTSPDTVEEQVYEMFGKQLERTKTAAFLDELDKISKDKTQTGDDEDHIVRGTQSDDVPELLQPDEGPGSGSRGPTEALSQSGEQEHRENREKGYLPGAFARFSAGARESGSTLREKLDSFGPKAVSSSAMVNEAQEKRSAAFFDELQEISGK